MAEIPNSANFYENPDFIENLGYYQEISDFRNGDKATLTKQAYLWPHAFEQEERQIDERDKKVSREDRALREKRTEYVNYLEMVLNRIVSLVVKGGLDYGDAAKLFEDYKDDVDGQGNSLDSFFTQQIANELSFGACYALVNTKTMIGVRSQADVKLLGIRPYFVNIHPLILRDWQKLNSGQYEAIRYEYHSIKTRTSLSQEPELVRYCEVWTLDELKRVTISTYQSVDEKGIIINYSPTARVKANHYTWQLLGEPVIVEGIDRIPISHSQSAKPWLKDVLPIVRKIFNKQSDLDNLIYHQGYEQRFIMADLDNVVDAGGKPLSPEQKSIKLAHNSYVILPETSKIETVAPLMPEAIFKSIADDLVSLFQIAFNMLRVVPPDSKQGEAAESRKELKEDLLTRINEKRAQYLSFINQSVNNFAMYATKDLNYKADVQFLKPLEQGDISELIAYVRQIQDMIKPYPTWEKAVHKRVANEMMLSESDEIQAEIESTDLEAVREAEQAEIDASFKGLVNTNKKAE